MKAIFVRPWFVALILAAMTFGVTSCGDDDDGGSTVNNPIIGSWVSAGTDVAPLLVTYFHVDTVYATFTSSDSLASNGSYTVKQVNDDATVVNYSGTFTVADSGDIFTISISQAVPYVATVGGIFQVFDASPDSMKYEVVQLSGTTNVAPTPTGGFGSTNGGALGTINIQRYKRVSQ